MNIDTFASASTVSAANPFSKALAAAWSELSKPESLEWYKDTTWHLALASYAITRAACLKTVAAGRQTRTWLDSLASESISAPPHQEVIALLPPSEESEVNHPPEPEPKPSIALLPPSPDLSNPSPEAAAEAVDMAEVIEPSNPTETDKPCLPTLASPRPAPTKPVSLKQQTVSALRAMCDHQGIRWRGANQGKHLSKAELVRLLSESAPRETVAVMQTHPV